MIATGFALVGALVALVGLLFTATDTALVRRVAVPCLVLFIALGAFIDAAPEGVNKAAIVAVAHGADGLPAASSVTFQETDGGRTVRRVALQRALPMAAPMLFATAGLALALLLVVGTRFGGGTVGRFGGPAVAVLAALSGLVLGGGVGGLTGTGEAEVRAVLSTLGLDALGAPSSFTVPEGTWSYRAGSPVGLYAAAVVGLVIAFVPARVRPWGPSLIAVGAALAAVGPVLAVLLTGGLAWRPETGLLWATGLVTAGVVFDRQAPARAGALAGVGAALAILLI